MNEPGRIDVHHHIMPKEYTKELDARGIHDAGGVEIPDWSPESAIELMDRQGIATAVVSISAPGVHLGHGPAAGALARRSNEIMARLIKDHPTRFGGFAAIPLPDVDRSLEEMAYALDTLALDGVGVMASVGGVYLGDPSLDPVFAELNRRKAVVHVHPTVPKSSESLKLEIPGTLTEFIFDTTRAIANLIFSGTLEKYPDVKLIFSHAGGAAPYIANRLALGAFSPTLNAKAPKGALHYLRQLYYDTAISANPVAFAALTKVVDPSHVLFGSDHPFLPEPLIAKQVEGITTYPGFDAEAIESIERGNALNLLPRLRSALAIA